METKKLKLSDSNMELLLTLILKPSSRNWLLMELFTTFKFINGSETSMIFGNPESTIKLDSTELDIFIPFWEAQ